MLAGFYGDDFTGSTDALGQFSRWGLSSILLLETPDAATLRAHAAKYEVVGVAGIARSLASANIAAEIRPVLECFAALDCKLFQYKICSTFDSSPAIGSFGPPIELGRELFGGPPFAIVPAQPDFGRYTLFGNHFANFAGTTYRLDRHPTMSRHPSTPIDEADLRAHLAAQSEVATALFPLTALRSPQRRAAFDRLLAEEPAAIVFDVLDNDDLAALARLLQETFAGRRLYALGSGGLSYGFGATWSEGRTLPALPRIEAIEKLLVVSGSASPQTAAQIEWAMANGWAGVRIEPASVFTTDTQRRTAAIARLSEELSHAFRGAKRGAVLYSALGPQDVQTGFALDGLSPAQLLGEALGSIVRALVEAHGLRRAVIAGGDTSSYAARAMAARSLEIIKMLVPVGPLCLIHSADPKIEGLELVLKGGQVGDERFFEMVRAGG